MERASKLPLAGSSPAEGALLGRIECWYSYLALNQGVTGPIPVFPTCSFAIFRRAAKGGDSKTAKCTDSSMVERLK